CICGGKASDMALTVAAAFGATAADDGSQNAAGAAARRRRQGHPVRNFMAGTHSFVNGDQEVEPSRSPVQRIRPALYSDKNPACIWGTVGRRGHPALDYLLCASADDVACLWLVNRGNDEARKIRSLRCAHVARQRGSMAGLGGRGTCRQCVPRESLWRPHSPR